MTASSNKILIYKSENGEVQLDVNLENETIWLTQEQIAKIFDVQRPAVAKHIGNIFKSGELEKKSVCSILEHTGNDGKTYKVQYYNLDLIISVGYRINSTKATKFRIWATNTLKKFITTGYVIDEKKLIEGYKNRLEELKDLVEFISSKANHPLLAGEEKKLFQFLKKYTTSIKILEEYDKGNFDLIKYSSPRFVFNLKSCLNIINTLRDEVVKQNSYGNLFGVDVENKLDNILHTINQTFDGKDLYSSIEEKASNLLYLIIKDHPFLDGNKRIGSILFIYFLKENDFLYDREGKEKFAKNTLVTLSLLVASSNPKEKDLIIKLVQRLLQ